MSKHSYTVTTVRRVEEAIKYWISASVALIIPMVNQYQNEHTLPIYQILENIYSNISHHIIERICKWKCVFDIIVDTSSSII